MIPAQQVADDVLAEAARRGGADDTIVLIQDSSEASLRWAGSSMTTNGESVKRSIAVTASAPVPPAMDSSSRIRTSPSSAAETPRWKKRHSSHDLPAALP